MMMVGRPEQPYQAAAGDVMLVYTDPDRSWRNASLKASGVSRLCTSMD